ncbi:unnamed protein product, partial [marine sediment metagenome]
MGPHLIFTTPLNSEMETGKVFAALPVRINANKRLIGKGKIIV